jgi:hypothetical protein
VGRHVYRVLVGRPEGKRPLGRPKRRREDNKKTDTITVTLLGTSNLYRSNITENYLQTRYML